MKKIMKNSQKRWRGLLAIAVAFVLVAGWVQLPKVIHATENAFPEASLASSYGSGDVTSSGDTGSGSTSSGDVGSGDTGSGDTGSSDTGSSDTGSSDTGSGDTGSSDTGSSDTGSGDTGSGDTGSSDTGSSDTGSGDTGSSDTGSEDTGSSDTGSEGTGSDDTGSEGTGSDDTGSEGTGSDDTGSEGTGSDDTGSEGTGSDDAGSEGTGSDDTGSEGTGSDDAGSEDAGNSDTGSGDTGSESNPGSEDTSNSEKPSNTEPPKTKLNGQVSVRMDDYVYGGTAPSVWVSSLTGDAKKATITFKVTGAADSTYSSTVPTEAGNYTVRAVLPATDTHTSAAATDTFSINYLTAPTPAFNISGIRGEAGWYTSDVRIKPPAGYELSVGDRAHFSAEAYVISETQADLRLFLKKTDTGEMTSQLAIAHLRIDKADPVLKGIINDETYYGDEFVINVVEENIKSVQVNGTEVELEQDENGNNVIILKPGTELEEYEVSVTDKAGNKAVYQFKLALESTLEGMVREGEMTLEPGVKYTFPQGSDWKMYGDDTIYSGGVSFYVTQEKTAHFSKY